jgi:general secretion pathway protein H
MGRTLSSRIVSARRRAGERGLTLIEMLVVLAIVGLFAAGVLMGTGQLASAKLKKTATSLTGVIRLAYTRASSTSKSIRLVFDFEQRSFWMEEAEQPMLVTPKDTTGTGGADAVTALEQQSIAEGQRLTKGPTAPRAHFRQVDMGLLAIDDDTHGNVRSLPGNIKFRSIQTTHDDLPRTADRAYLYFWPGGQTERASIQIRIGDSTEDFETLTLLVAPLTGSTNIKSGPVPLTIPKDDTEASDREDRGL